nr:HlyD family efflux transporter periplasmic adaptor subunit [uncultured Dyadobacter sp.]
MKKVCLLLMSVIATLMACKKEPKSTKVTTRPVNEAVYASGEIMPAEYELVKAKSSERLLQILVRQGEDVRKGQVVAVLGEPGQNAQIDILGRQLRLARQSASDSAARGLELRQKAMLAKAQYEHDLQEAGKYQELAAEKAVPSQQAEQQVLKAKASLAEYKSLQYQYDALQVDQKDKVLAVSAQLAQLRQAKEGKLLTSSITGRIFSVYLSEGAVTSPTEPVLLLGTAGHFKLELLVDERDIAKVRLGQRVLFETDAFEGKQFTAAVSKIVPVVQKENRSFKVEARVEDATGFFPQSAVEANILIRHTKDALAIPSTYLLPGDSVWIAGPGGEVVKRKVVAGVRSGQWAEIKSGLRIGNSVYESAKR